MAASMRATPSGLPPDSLRTLSRPCPDHLWTPSGPPLDPLTFPDVVDGDNEAYHQIGGHPQHYWEHELGLPVTFEHLVLRAHQNVALLP
eukprot:3447098-Pyramimonas_sp.AAC.1